MMEVFIANYFNVVSWTSREFGFELFSCRRHPFSMNNLNSLQEIARAIRNLIRTGIVTDVDYDEGLCRVQTGGMETTWLNWLTCRAGRSRVWWALSVGEQVLLLAVGGELDTAFVLPGIFSEDHPAPSASPDALHVTFPDGAVMRQKHRLCVPLRRSGTKYSAVSRSFQSLWRLAVQIYFPKHRWRLKALSAL